LTAPGVPIHGRCDDAFARVRDAFAENFVAEGEIGAAFAVRLGGRTVVDLWGGHRDDARRTPWERDTLVNAYSVGKAFVAMLALGLVESARLALDAPVARFWPEFAAEDKSACTVRELLSHRAGLPAVRRRLGPRDPFAWPRMTGALAAQAPFWTPSDGHGYHVNTYGYLVGELVRRATGLRVGAALRGLLTGPLGADFHFGLPASEHARVAPIQGVGSVRRPPREALAAALPRTGDAARDEMILAAYANPPELCGLGCVNSAAWRLAEIPSTNGHGTARAVASLYASLLAGGTRALPIGEGLRREATTVHSEGTDLVLDRATRFGLGFQLAAANRPLGPSPGDPDAGLALGYLTNRPGERWRTPRTQRLLGALYACLGA
jgi:CubicO group peptidase (beta-lactamase class C family)